jgi:hypothetical protein
MCPAAGARPSSWQSAPAERVRQVAALLLAEFGGLTVNTVGPLTDLLLTEDDLLQNRALQCITSRSGGPSNSVTRIGATGVEQLARFAMEHSWDLPGAALAVTWFNETLLHDDPRALSSWCDEAELTADRGSAAARIVKSVEWATETSWSVLLDRLRDGGPDIRFAILRSFSVMLYRSSTDTGEWTAEDSHLRMDAARWARTRALLRTLDPEPLRGYRWLPAQMEDIVDAAEDALEATGGVLDNLSGSRASTALWQRAGTDFGTIVSTGDETGLRTVFYQVGQSNIVQLDNNTRAVQALRARDMKPSRWDWPWTGLLTSWAADLLTTSPQDAPWAWERCSVLEVLAASAEMNPDTFRRRADVESLDRLLTHAALYHNAFPGRAAVGRMLAVRRHGSPRILDALQHMLHDTAPTVRQAALDAIPRLRSVDRSLVDNLAEAVQDPKSERTVHFSFVDVAIPQLPELDDVFIDALRKIYRL